MFPLHAGFPVAAAGRRNGNKKKAAFLGFTVEIIRRSDAAKSLTVLPRRWVVECTFGWMSPWRRLVRDYEESIDCSEAMLHVALGSLLRKRIVHQ